jgi:hypothetical protein
MLKKTLIALVLPLAFAAHAQSTPAKKDLVARILKHQQPGVEAMARGLAEQPAAAMLDRASTALAVRVPPEKREAVAKEIQADAKKYADETVPLVQGRAVKLAPATIGALLEEKFSEDELKQVVAIIESPAYVKFQQLGGDMQKVLVEKLLADTRPQVEAKLKVMEASIAKRLGITPPPAAAAAPAKPAAK